MNIKMNITEIEINFKNLTKEEFIKLILKLDLSIINNVFLDFEKSKKNKTSIKSFWRGFRVGTPLPKNIIERSLGEIYDNDYYPLERILLEVVILTYLTKQEDSMTIQDILANISDLEVSLLIHKLFDVDKNYSYDEVTKQLKNIIDSNEEKLIDLKKEFNEEKEDLINKHNLEIDELKDKNSKLSQEINDINTKYTKIDKDYDELRKKYEELLSEIKQKEEIITTKTPILNTLDVLKDFNTFLLQEGYNYDKQDVYDFVYALMTRKLTILAGRPGIGKSRLALLFAKFFNLKEEDNTMLFLPISPSYTEPGDILGFYNPRNNKYVPSDTNLVDFLIHASNNKEQVHLLIFDEMNLAQIEYYFAPFISALERKNSYITLYPKGVECLNSKTYPNQVILTDNLLIVGTINKDETTRVLSERLLDRIYYIDLNKTDFSVHRNNQLIYKGIKNHFNYDINEFIIPLPLSINDILSNRETNLLDELNQIFKDNLMNFSVSYRNVYNISLLVYFMKNSLSQDVAFDKAIKETILTKVSGSSLVLTDIISKIINIFNKYKDVSTFTYSSSYLNFKQKELDKYGYIR